VVVGRLHEQLEQRDARRLGRFLLDDVSTLAQGQRDSWAMTVQCRPPRRAQPGERPAAQRQAEDDACGVVAARPRGADGDRERPSALVERHQGAGGPGGPQLRPVSRWPGRRRRRHGRVEERHHVDHGLLVGVHRPDRLERRRQSLGGAGRLEADLLRRLELPDRPRHGRAPGSGRHRAVVGTAETQWS
jgi:hypothetical protein